MTVFVLVDIKTGLYHRRINTCKDVLVKELDKATLFKTIGSARKAANHGFELRLNNGQERWTVYSVDVKLLGVVFNGNAEPRPTWKDEHPGRFA